MKQKIQYISSDKVPYYSMLSDYKWVPDFVKLEAARFKLLQLKNQEHDPYMLTREEFLEQIREQWQDYENYRLERMKRYLNNFRFKGSNPFDSYIILKTEVPPFLPFEQFESAIREMDGLGISSEDVQKNNLSIIDRQKSLENLIKKLCPKDFFVMSGGNVDFDVREKYVTRWRELQKKVDLPLAPNGILLKESPREEKRAWMELVGHEYVNPHADLTPDFNE
ncbi:MAG: hypothetical protein C4518_08480 [Desulfobacteraceae bacterium]|nr:MAG: hypothetical protein C4518_08480 [Desulfobacteraceae bacterium]